MVEMRPYFRHFSYFQALFEACYPQKGTLSPLQVTSGFLSAHVLPSADWHMRTAHSAYADFSQALDIEPCESQMCL